MSISFCQALLAQPANDSWSTSVPLLTANATCAPVAGTVANATLDGTTNSCPGTERYDVWYRFVAQSANPTVTLQNRGANFITPGLQVLSGSSSGTSMGCGTTSVTPTTLTPGTTYYVRVFSTAASTPTTAAGFEVCLTDNEPGNDAWSTSVPVLTVGSTCSPTVGTVANATLDGTTNSCPGTERYDVWYQFVAASVNPTITLQNRGANFTNPELQILSGGSGGTSITCGTTAGAVTTATPTSLTPGTTYYVRVFSTSVTTPTTAAGFEICVTYTPPENDTWSTAVPALSVGSTCSPTTGTVASATLDGTVNSCSGTELYDVWYQFVATAGNISVTLQNIGANFTTPRLQAFSGSSSGTSLGCGTTSLNLSGLTTGTTYYIRVFSTAAAPVPTTNAGFEICITTNDLCEGAPTLTPGTGCSALTQTLYAATASGPSSHYGTAYDAWYRFTVPAGRNTVTITVGGLGGSLNNNNCFIEAFRASDCGGVTTANAIGSASVGTDLTLGNLIGGGTYYFRVLTTTNPSVNPTNWGFNVCVSYVNAAPSNDECSGSIILTPGTTQTGATLANATPSASISVGCATGTPDDDVWFHFVPVRSYATVTVNANSVLNHSGAMIQVFSGTCGSLVSIGCGEDAVNLSSLNTSQTYYVRVYSKGANGTDAFAGAGTSGVDFNIAVTPAASVRVDGSRLNEVYEQTVLSNGQILLDPWEVTYGPDGFLWITESKGYRVVRMDPNTGARTTVLDVSRGSTFLLPGDTSFNMRFEIGVNNPQGGFAGLAVHPNFPATPYVYVSYVHSYDGAAANSAGVFFTNRIVRFTYNSGTGKLESPVSLCNTLPGSGDHNSQRIIIAPVDGVNYLFYAAGDLGAGQFGNASRPIRSQNLDAYEGKILRFNLVDDGDANLANKWIPNDNPYNGTPMAPATQNAIWCTGIRNNQGFAYGTFIKNGTPVGRLFGSSHGPYSDDEINEIEGDKNYGHPVVIGYFADNNYNGAKAGHRNGGDATSMPLIGNETTNKNAISNYKDPLHSAYPGTLGSPTEAFDIWNRAEDPMLPDIGNGLWPSEGWSGLDLYTHTLVPGWKNSLIAASLKWGRVMKLKLNETGDTIIPVAGFDTVAYFGSVNRFRDISLAPNGKDMYVIMDRSSSSSGPSAGNPVIAACAGCVQKYTFLGYASLGAGNRSAISSGIPVTPGGSNSCRTGTSITVDQTNRDLWVPITGPDGNVVAEIKTGTLNLGVVQSSFYTASTVRTIGGRRFAGRNVYIDPTTAAGSNVSIRFYLTKTEYDALVDAGGSSVITDLRVLRNTDVCRTYPVSAATVFTPDVAELHGTDAYVLQVNSITLDEASSYYFATNNFILPLDLLTFDGSLKNNTTHLKWTAENEQHLNRYEVERSLDGINFIRIGSVVPAGQNGERAHYAYDDRNVRSLNTQSIHYRLRMMDSDGSFHYSNVVTINLTEANAYVNVTPNPVNSVAQLRVRGVVDGTVNWQLFDGAGRSVASGQLRANRSSSTTVDIDMQAYAQGNYFIQVTGAGLDTKIKVQKL